VVCAHSLLAPKADPLNRCLKDTAPSPGSLQQSSRRLPLPHPAGWCRWISQSFNRSPTQKKKDYLISDTPSPQHSCFFSRQLSRIQQSFNLSLVPSELVHLTPELKLGSPCHPRMRSGSRFPRCQFDRKTSSSLDSRQRQAMPYHVLLPATDTLASKQEKANARDGRLDYALEYLIGPIVCRQPRPCVPWFSPG